MERNSMLKVFVRDGKICLESNGQALLIEPADTMKLIDALSSALGKISADKHLATHAELSKNYVQ